MKTPFLRSTFLVLFAGAMLISTAVVHAQAGRDTSMSGAHAEAVARGTADSLRREVLKFATFAGFADTSCAPGDIRTFERDTTDAVKGLLAHLEMIVLSYGANASLDNDAGKALLRAVVRLEGGGPGPRWDAMTGVAPRAFNPVRPISMFNPETKQCVMTPGNEPDGIVLPEVTGFVVPRDSGGGSMTVGFGRPAQNDIRNLFFSRNRNDANAVLRITRVNTHAMWGDYAMIGISREKELKGVVAVPRETTGAVYAFHRVGKEWRLLALVRNW